MSRIIKKLNYVKYSSIGNWLCLLTNYSTLTYYIYAFSVFTRVTDTTFRVIRICPNVPKGRAIAHLNSILILK